MDKWGNTGSLIYTSSGHLNWTVL